MSTESPHWRSPVQARATAAPATYQLFIHLRRACRVAPGRLGAWRLPPGWYVYTGSARGGIESRLRRHLRRAKPLRWHIDWLLARDEARIRWIRLRSAAECPANRALGGAVVVPGFGASDCRAGCDSHLRYLGRRWPAAVPTDRSARRAALAPYRPRRARP